MEQRCLNPHAFCILQYKISIFGYRTLFLNNGLRELKITSRIAEDSLRNVKIALNTLTGGIQTSSIWLQEPFEPPKTPPREAKILKIPCKNQCILLSGFFALNGLLRLNMAPRWPKREPQDGPQRGPRRVQERSRAPQARPRRRPRGDFFFRGGDAEQYVYLFWSMVPR